MLHPTTTDSRADPRVNGAAPKHESTLHPFHCTTTVADAVVPSRSDHPLALLHQTLGNQWVLRNLSHSRPAIQTKLTINTSGDQFEQEADRVSEQVMRMATPGAALPAVSQSVSKVQRACSCGGACDSCQKENASEMHDHLQRKSAAGAASARSAPLPAATPAVVHDVLGSPGQPLDAATRSFMEPRFGRNLGDVRIHTGARADMSARSMNALAYTVGPHIAFASGHYSPCSNAGRRLLAHELAHVTQQRHAETPHVQRFVGCNPARLSLEDCPAREKGEERIAREGGMPFFNYSDSVENVEGMLIANFDIGTAKLKPQLKEMIYWKEFLRKIARNRSRWDLVGFTDCAGGETLNKALRKRRAKAVFDILPPRIQSQIDTQDGAPITQCIRDNTTRQDRTLNRSVLFQFGSYDADFSSKPMVVSPDSPPAVETKHCTRRQSDRLALAFRFAKRMVDRAISIADHMKRGSPEEALLLKYFGANAWEARNEIRRTYRRMQRDWNDDIVFRCETAEDRDKTFTIGRQQIKIEGDCNSGTEGLTGVIPILTNGHLGSILICDSAFTTNVLPETGLAETILHEVSHALEWTFDEGYCDRRHGCSLHTDEAIHNGDSYSGFAGEALSRWGPG